MFFVPELSKGIQWLGRFFHSDMARMIANVHTVFNLSIAVIFIPFTSSFARLIMKILPDKPEAPSPLASTCSLLDDSHILSPALAIGLARAEIARMAETLEIMLRAVAVPFVTNEPKRDKYYPEYSLIQGIDLREDIIDCYETKIVNYLVKTAQSGASDEQTRIAYAMISIVKDMESIGDIIHRNVLTLIKKKQSLQYDFSREGKEELAIYHQKVCKQIRLLKEAFFEVDNVKAEQIMARERKYLDLELQYRARHLDRLVLQKKESVATHEIHMELMNFMVQIIVYSSNIAKTFLQTSKQDQKLIL
jgi:phosphate:Na+ symporter